MDTQNTTRELFTKGGEPVPVDSFPVTVCIVAMDANGQRSTEKFFDLTMHNYWKPRLEDHRRFKLVPRLLSIIQQAHATRIVMIEQLRFHFTGDSGLPCSMCDQTPDVVTDFDVWQSTPGAANKQFVVTKRD